MLNQIYQIFKVVIFIMANFGIADLSTALVFEVAWLG